MHRLVLSAVLLLVASVLPLSGRAQESPKLALPSDPSMWVNSAPISMEAIQGKAALMWFYEEDCPRCRAKWPNLIALSNKFAGQPIVFIAVNSGNVRPEVEGYLGETRVPWPTIVDPTRQFERMCGVPEVSLRNIYQVRTIGPDGRMRTGSPDNLEGAANDALEGAKWNVEPSTIPAPLKAAWSAVEFDDFPAGAALIKKSLKSPKPEVKQAATTLQEFVSTKIDEAVASATTTTASGDPWQTYSAYHQIAVQFEGYDLPDEVTSQLKQLATQEEVKKQQALLKQLQSAKKSLGSTSRSARTGAVNRLKRLAQDSPDSDAGKEAAQLLQQIGEM